MPVDLEDLRLPIYTSLASTGRAPGIAALAVTLGASGDEIVAGLRRLAAARHLALDADVLGGASRGSPVVRSHPGPDTRQREIGS